MTQLHSIQPVPDVRFPMSSCRVNMNEWNEWLKGKTSQWRQGGGGGEEIKKKTLFDGLWYKIIGH